MPRDSCCAKALKRRFAKLQSHHLVLTCAALPDLQRGSSSLFAIGVAIQAGKDWLMRSIEQMYASSACATRG
jgi:hypothetical protein